MTTSVPLVRVIACMSILHFQSLLADISLDPVPNRPGLYQFDEYDENFYMIMAPKVVCNRCKRKKDKYEEPQSLLRRCESMAEGATIPRYFTTEEIEGLKDRYSELMEDISSDDAPPLVFMVTAKHYKFLEKAGSVYYYNHNYHNHNYYNYYNHYHHNHHYYNHYHHNHHDHNHHDHNHYDHNHYYHYHDHHYNHHYYNHYHHNHYYHYDDHHHNHLYHNFYHHKHLHEHDHHHNNSDYYHNHCYYKHLYCNHHWGDHDNHDSCNDERYYDEGCCHKAHNYSDHCANHAYHIHFCAT
uniref:Uncharacterized protein n=1 Tax=Ascaris lumbricoides TaxID=6252 RepID=A0A9J2PU29_ASCLU